MSGEFNNKVSVSKSLVASYDGRDFIFNSFSVNRVNVNFEGSALSLRVSDSLSDDGGGVE